MLICGICGWEKATSCKPQATSKKIIKKCSMFRFYHNPKCKISRQGLSILQEKGIKLEIIEYLKKPLTTSELKKLLIKLNLKPIELIRTKEKLYKENFKGKKFTDEEWIKIISENPVLIERPIIEKEYKAVIGRPVENLLEIL